MDCRNNPFPAGSINITSYFVFISYIQGLTLKNRLEVNLDALSPATEQELLLIIPPFMEVTHGSILWKLFREVTFVSGVLPQLRQKRNIVHVQII